MIDKDADFPLACPWPSLQGSGFAILFLFLALVIIYGNSWHCSWHFDDYKNIVENANVQMEQLSWKEIRTALAGLPGEGMQRPVAYLSFALNYALGQRDVFGYHLVNLFIHYLAALFLFFFIQRTLQLPLLKERYGNHAYSIAILAAFLWALHPIQVFAVTYIVQRMASLSALFSIMAMLFYLLARTGEKKKVFYFVLSALSALLALGTKENAIMLPLVIFLYDLFLIRGITAESLRQYAKLSIIPLMLILAVAWLLVDPAKLLDGYRIRPFTLEERLLTQPRVLVFYVSLLLYPLSSRFVLLQDLELSRSLFSPWTTLPAILLVLFALGLVLFWARKKPLFSFSILFFLLNHLVEGSFLPLEMIYEHRNYLPAMLFFVPLAVLFTRGFAYYAHRRVLCLALAAIPVAFLVMEGVAVVLQNDTLKNELTFWHDTVEKSPRLHRPRHNLAKTYLALGLIPESCTEFRRALDGKVMSATFQKYETHFYLGQCDRLRGDDKGAWQHFAEALRLVPFYAEAHQGQAEILLSRGEYGAAEQAIRRALAYNASLPSFHLTFGEILLKKGDLPGALTEARKALILKDDSGRAYGLLAAIFPEGKDVRASHFQRLARKSRGAAP